MSVSFIRGENPLSADKLNTAFGERVLRSGDTMDGLLTLARDPISAFDAATKQYVDARSALMGPPGPPGSALDFASPPPMGSTTPNTGAFTTLASTGTASLGTGSGNYVQVTGAATNPTMQVAGTGTNGALLVRGQGTGGVNLGNTLGNILNLVGGVTNGDTLRITQPPTAATAVKIDTTAVGSSGINITPSVLFNHPFTYTGTATDPGNTPFKVTQVIGGISGNAAGYVINSLDATFSNFKASQNSIAWGILAHVGSGTMFRTARALNVTMNQNAQPLTLTQCAWQPNHVYTVVGEPVVNGPNVYQVTVAGTSAASGGPTGTGGAITDGTVTWKTVISASDFQYQLSGVIEANANFNVGGTPAAPAGNNFGSVISAALGGTASGYWNQSGLEVDTNITAPASVIKNNAFSIVQFGDQGLERDSAMQITGLTNGYRNGIQFARGGIDPNGVAIAVYDIALAAVTPMAGFIDALLCNPNGLNNLAAYGTGGGGYILRSNNSQWLGNGNLQLGNASLAISANALTIDTTHQRLTAVSAPTGGSGWSGSQLAVDEYGNIGQVNVTGTTPSSVTLAPGGVPLPASYVPTASVPGGAVTWRPLGVSAILGPTGANTKPVNFTTTETYTAGTTINIGTGEATVVNVGRAAATTTFAGKLKTAALLTNAANDAAAAGAGVGVGEFYRNGSIVMQRVA